MRGRVRALLPLFLLLVVIGTGVAHAQGDGSILVWGYNESGQVDVPLPNSGFTAIAATGLHILALREDGSITAWGYNAYDQCLVPNPNTGFAAIAAGGLHSLALKADGSVRAWGMNSYGQCDLPAPNAGFVKIAAGGYHSLALRSDGSIAAWGANDYGQCNVPSPNAGFVAIAAGLRHSLGLKANGSIVAWGNNISGQCNVPAPNSGFIAVAAGGAHSLGLRASGDVLAWGYNEWGQCNVPEPNANFTAIAAGTSHSLGLKSDGSIAGWGDTLWGESTAPDPNAGFTAVAAAGGFSVVLYGLPVGACCHEDGTCMITEESGCLPPSTWSGIGSFCDPNFCAQPPTPVLLESSEFTSLPEGLRLRWEIPLGTTGALFRAWRDLAAGSGDVAPTPEAALVSATWASPNAEGIVEILDPEAPSGVTIRYFLEASIPGATAEFLGPLEARRDAPAATWRIGPNPSRGTVQLTPPVAGAARASIFDPAGRLVRMLRRDGGVAPLVWNGRDASGREASAGTYLVRMSCGEKEEIGRLVKTR